MNCSRPLLSRSGCIYVEMYQICHQTSVLVPFYRGAVVFMSYAINGFKKYNVFSSPFIEERLYLEHNSNVLNMVYLVLVPFYRGAVVFKYHARL